MNCTQHLKSVIGQDLFSLLLYMSSQEAGRLLDGYLQSGKGFDFLRETTLQSIYEDLGLGLFKRYVRERLNEPLTGVDEMEHGEFRLGLQQLNEEMNTRTPRENEEYFSYLSLWDLQGHDWQYERPDSFVQYLSRLQILS